MPDSLAIVLLYVSLLGCPVVSTWMAFRLSKRRANPLICVFGGFIAGLVVLIAPQFNHELARALGPGVFAFPMLFLVAGAGAFGGTLMGRGRRDS